MTESMKKLFLIFLSFCLIGLFAACDKDEETNPFVGTTWVRRTSQVVYEQLYYTYDVIYFKSNRACVRWAEDERGYIIRRQRYGTYEITDRRLGDLTLHLESSVLQCRFVDDPPSYFYFEEEGQEMVFYRQRN